MFTPIDHAPASTEQKSESTRAFLTSPTMLNITQSAQAEDTIAQLSSLFIPECVYELRAIVFEPDDPRTDIESGLFYGRELVAMAREIQRLSGKCRGIYATINPRVSERFAHLPTARRLKPAFRTTKDDKVPTVHEIVLDFDSVKAAGHENDPATDAERDFAWAELMVARARAAAEGWPAPTVQDSGNGYYLRFHVEPFAVGADNDLVRRVLAAFGADTTCCNPSRVMRLPGGINCKATATEERPWRMSRLLEVGSLEKVTREQLERIAATVLATPPAAKRKASSVADDDAAMQAFNEWAGVTPSSTNCTRLTSALEERVSRYLDTIETAVAGQRGSNPTLWAARVLIHGFQFSESDTFTLLDRHYNPRCAPPWSPKELQHKIGDAASKPFRKQEGWALQSRPDRRPNSIAQLTDEEAAIVGRIMAAEFKAKAAALPPDAPVEIIEPCPFTASKDMRDEINLSAPRCQFQSPVRFQKGTIRFVCNRDCGNGTDCRDCLNKRLNKLLKMSDSYLIRTSVAVEPSESSEPVQPRIVYGAIKPTGPTSANKKAILRRGGERVSVLTEDAEVVASLLAGEKASGSDVSRFLLTVRNEDNGEIGTLPLSPSETHLWIISLPAGIEPPDDFHRVSVAAAIRAMHHAAKTIPTVPDGTRRYRPTHKSAAWGDEEEKVSTNTKCLGPSAFKVNDVRDILQAANVPIVAVQFDDKRSRTQGVGWALPAVQSAAMNVWIGGTAAPWRPTVERVVKLAQHWLPLLAKYGHDLGEGRRVQQVLRENLWHTNLYEIDQQLKDADEQDRAEEAFTIEAESILRALRDQYRGREHEAVGLVACLLA